MSDHPRDDGPKGPGDQHNGSTWEVGGRRVMRYETFVAKVRAPYEAELARREAQASPGASEPDTESRLAREIREETRRERQAARERELRAAIAPETGVTDELTGHNYDGIQEYDNPTPGWWWLIFWGSVVYSVFYVAFYHFSPLFGTQVERHANAENRMLSVRFAELGAIPMGEEKLLRIMNQEAWLDQGASIFDNNCALCHGDHGQGLVGPNLTDEYFKNATTLAGIADVIENGAANNAMPAQNTILNENEIALVAAYVASLRGTTLPPDVTPPPKAPEGETIPPWPTLPEEDTPGG